MIAHEYTSCPICASQSLTEIFTHKIWRIPVLQCANCTHKFASKHMIQEEDIFNSNGERANLYASIVEKIKPNTLLDVGTPADFYFLRKVHTLCPETKLLALDLYEKKHPEFISMIHAFPQDGIQLTSAFHVLEHVQNPISFVKDLCVCSQQFLIEIPNCHSLKRSRFSSYKPHTHFFNRDSMNCLMQQIVPTWKLIERKGDGNPINFSQLVVHNLDDQLNILRTFTHIVPLIRSLGSTLGLYKYLLS